MRLYLVFFLFLLGHQLMGQGFQGISTELKKQIEKANEKKDLIQLGQFFIGRPYSHMALSKANPEKVYYSFQDFDCVTFIENILALYLSKGIDSTFQRHLIDLRYFKSNDISYETRMHYLSSALEKWQKLGIVSQIHYSKEQVLQKNIHYLSSYLHDKNLPIDLAQIQKTEQAISKKTISYIDPKNVGQFLSKLKSGDIIAFLSKRSDLDFKHVGFITIQRGKTYLLHASQEKKVICTSDQDLVSYLKNHPAMIGIQVYRPN